MAATRDVPYPSFNFTVNFDGQEVFSAEMFPGISANPYLSFYFKVPGPGEFEFTWVEDGGARVVQKEKLNVVA